MSPPWVNHSLELLEKGPCVLITLRQHKGSAPRESGARMVVGADEVKGSIGGGNLEHQAIATAQEMLAEHRHPGNAERKTQRHPGSAKRKTQRHPGKAKRKTQRHPGRAKRKTQRHPGKAEGLIRDPLVGSEPPSKPVDPGQHALRHSPGASFAARKPHRPHCLRYSRFRDDASVIHVEPYGLGPALNQCCGGSVELMFELLSPPAPDWLDALASANAKGDPAVLATAIDADNPRHLVALPVGRESDLPEDLRAPVRTMLDDAAHNAIEVVAAEGCDWWLQRVARNRKPLVLFGAGHVGKAVVKALADLPFEVRWVDSRDYEFPEAIPDNASPVRTNDPLTEVGQAAPQTNFIVMTHSHDLDEDICHAILERGDFAFLGLIGSTSKHRRFVHRLGKRGIPEDVLERLVCPVGLPGIAGKEPATIALSLAAQLMSAPRENS